MDPIVNFIATTKSKLFDIGIVEGQFIFLQDANVVTLDIDGVRKMYQMTDEINSSEKLTIDIPGFYYTRDTNVLWKYDGSDWTQITRSASEEQGIVNVVGTAENNIIISELGTGIFAVTGQYKITPTSGTTMTMGKDIFVCAPNHVNHVSGEKIYKYDLSPDGTFTVSSYITDADLGDYISKTEAEEIIARQIASSFEEAQATDQEIDDLFN